MEFDEDVERAIEQQVPKFFRNAARKALEKYAGEKGVDRVTMEVFEEAKAKYLASRGGDTDVTEPGE